MGRESQTPVARPTDDAVGIADTFESREFTSDELGAIKKTRRRSPRLGEARAEVQTFRAPPGLMDRIKQKAASDGITESQVIRDALDAYLSPR